MQQAPYFVIRHAVRRPEAQREIEEPATQAFGRDTVMLSEAGQCRCRDAISMLYFALQLKALNGGVLDRQVLQERAVEGGGAV
ncbi:hypothetical protein C8263_18270 [Deinococcus arcticus]|uniref:Uncharacterized protein n=1 Tax=Deinococcus arcticus TaxID=2136176 RepID=A0A2T3W3L6_9DEIO|nr:hypothetical protein C8263_18270 [Deinococcus arcticus]